MSLFGGTARSTNQNSVFGAELRKLEFSCGLCQAQFPREIQGTRLLEATARCGPTAVSTTAAQFCDSHFCSTGDSTAFPHFHASLTCIHVSRHCIHVCGACLHRLPHCCLLVPDCGATQLRACLILRFLSRELGSRGVLHTVFPSPRAYTVPTQRLVPPSALVAARRDPQRDLVALFGAV